MYRFSQRMGLSGFGSQLHNPTRSPLFICVPKTHSVFIRRTKESDFCFLTSLVINEARLLMEVHLDWQGTIKFRRQSLSQKHHQKNNSIKSFSGIRYADAKTGRRASIGVMVSCAACRAFQCRIESASTNRIAPCLLLSQPQRITCRSKNCLMAAPPLEILVQTQHTFGLHSPEIEN